MSKKRGETKMVDDVRYVGKAHGRAVVCDLTEDIEMDLSGFAALGKQAAQNRVCVVSESVRNSVLTSEQPRARSRTFIAKPCTICTALRPPNTNYTRVYASRETARYCKCSYCGNTWKDLEKT